VALGKFCPHSVLAKKTFPPPVGALGQAPPDLMFAAGIRIAFAENGYLPSSLQ